SGGLGGRLAGLLLPLLDLLLRNADPAVMPRLDLIRLSGSDLRLTAVVAENMKAARQNVADVVRLARVGLRDRLHALGPPPSRLERVATDRRATNLHHLDLSVVERPSLVGAVHASVRYAHLTPPLSTGAILFQFHPLND